MHFKHHLSQQLLLSNNSNNCIVLIIKKKREKGFNIKKNWNCRNNGKWNMRERWNNNLPKNRKKHKRLLLKLQESHKQLRKRNSRLKGEDKNNFVKILKDQNKFLHSINQNQICTMNTDKSILLIKEVKVGIIRMTMVYRLMELE